MFLQFIGRTSFLIFQFFLHVILIKSTIFFRAVAKYDFPLSGYVVE